VSLLSSSFAQFVTSLHVEFRTGRMASPYPDRTFTGKNESACLARSSGVVFPDLK